MKFVAIIVRSLFKTFELFPYIGNPVRAINFNQKIKSLEKQKKFEETRIIREDAFIKIPPTYHRPFLRSEGEEKIYQLKN